MLYSKLFGKTVREAPADARSASHKLLHQAGYVRESTAGRYYFLPLGQKVQLKIMSVIRDEMNKAGAQEMLTPYLHPLSLWKETNRNKSAGYELMVVKDRREAEFALGGTAEEMIVDVLRKFQLSYKDLPFNVYQFSAKFRDELRARGGLLRVREFIMKDAYSFHENEEDFKKEYKRMGDTYTAIFKRLGLETAYVEADNGYIGGDYCHEFQFACEVGEDTVLKVPSTGASYNKEVAPSKAPEINDTEEMKPREDVEGKGIIGVEELAKYLKIPVESTTKTLLFEDEKGRVIAAAVRGGYDVSEAKLKKIVGAQLLVLASEKTVKNVTKAEVGYAGILNLPKDVIVVMDESMKGRRNFEMGANRTNYHSINVNFDRDLEEPKEFHDIKAAREGDIYPETGEKYEAYRGIEVGNIFQLGYYYSKKMKGAVFMDRDGKEKPYYMGCYGIGVGRTMAAIVEKYHDDKGIAWPEEIAPFQVHLIGLNLEDKEVETSAQNVYKQLNEHFEVLFDDRVDTQAGAKFADADLIGVPHRVVVSKKTADKVEYKRRGEKDAKLLSFEELLDTLKG